MSNPLKIPQNCGCDRRIFNMRYDQNKLRPVRFLLRHPLGIKMNTSDRSLDNNK